MAKTDPTAPKKAEEDFERAKSAVKKEADAAKDQIGEAADRLRDGASSIADKAKDAVSERAEEGKETVASSMADFATAVRKASNELGARDQSMAASLVREVAGGLEDASKAIHGRSVGDLTRSVSDFARRQPAAFLLGATVAGIALGRFIKATEDRHDDSGTAASSLGATITPGGAPTRASPASGTTPNRTSTRATPTAGTPTNGVYRGR
jgi:hypothetical protein